MKVVENVKGQTVQQIVDKYFEAGARGECDSYRSYLNLNGVQMEPKKYQTGDIHTRQSVI